MARGEHLEALIREERAALHRYTAMMAVELSRLAGALSDDEADPWTIADWDDLDRELGALKVYATRYDALRMGLHA